MLKKISIVFMLCLLLSMDSMQSYALEKDVFTLNESTSTRYNDTEWKYRVFNGKYQKRLWSATYNKWMTEWENF